MSESWTGAKAAWIESSLSPALLLHTEAREVRFFAGEPSTVSAVPRYLAFGSNGPKLVTNGTPANVTKMQERWLLVWFGEAPGWEKQDCPIAIFLQHPLDKLEFDTNGLTLRFSGAAGDLSIMPLYGARLVPSSLAELAALHPSREEQRKIPRVWEWTKSVPREPLTRVRYWSSALAKFPFAAWGCWQGDPARPDTMGFYTHFEQHVVPLAWAGSPLMLAPIPSSLANLNRAKPERVGVSRTVFDMDWPRLSTGLFAVPEGEQYSLHPPRGTEAAAQFKATVERAIHLTVAASTNGTAVEGGGWKEWIFDPGLATDAAESVLRFDPSRSSLQWGHTNATGRVRKSLRAVLLDGVHPEGWEEVSINGNARAFRTSVRR